MSTAEPNLLPGLWQLLVQRRSPSWPVSELMAACRPLAHDEELAAYFAPGAEDLFRHFVRERPSYFCYDAEQDTVTVAEDSPIAAVDHWLARYLALQTQAADGGLDIWSEALHNCLSAVPEPWLRGVLLTMSTAEPNLLPGLWQLLVQRRSPSWPVSELMAACRPLVHDEELAAYFAPGAEDLFRHFVRERPSYFCYDAEQDTVTVAEDSPIAAVDHWLARYLALQTQAADGGLDIWSEALHNCLSAVPGMSDHLMNLYDGNLEIFFRSHPRDFTVDKSGIVARMTLSFQRRNHALYLRERNLVLSFVDLLQKIGATKDNPCDVHTLTMYLPFMGEEERNALDVGYRDNLNRLFLLYPWEFITAAADSGYVSLRYCDPHYGEALFLKHQVQAHCGRTSVLSPGVSLPELTLIAKYSLSPVAPCLTGGRSVVARVSHIVQRHPAIFCVDLQAGEVCLRQEHPPWPEGRWSTDTELLAVLYFTDVLKHIDATSPSRAICFNYVVHAARTAPPHCRDYLECVYPALEVIELFHVHPGIFDLCSVNRVCLKTVQEAPFLEAAPENTGTESNPDSAEDQAVRYVVKLLKYARDLSPALLSVCVETAPLRVRNYCMASVEGRLQSVIESGGAALTTQEAQLSSLAPLHVRAKTVCEVSTKTEYQPAPEPVKFEPQKEREFFTGNLNSAEAEGQMACGVDVSGNMEVKEGAAAEPLAKAISAHEVSVVRALSEYARSTAAVETKIFDKGQPSSTDETGPQPVTCQLEKEEEAAKNGNNAQAEACGPEVFGRREVKKESAASSLLRAIAAHEVSGVRPLPDNAK
ncbi:uncharacterized protein LOC144098430 isoform X1 [Amblyomma americanum]